MGWSRLVLTEFGEQTSGKYRPHVTATAAAVTS